MKRYGQSDDQVIQVNGPSAKMKLGLTPVPKPIPLEPPPCQLSVEGLYWYNSESGQFDSTSEAGLLRQDVINCGSSLGTGASLDVLLEFATPEGSHDINIYAVPENLLVLHAITTNTNHLDTRSFATYSVAAFNPDYGTETNGVVSFKNHSYRIDGLSYGETTIVIDGSQTHMSVVLQGSPS